MNQEKSFFRTTLEIAVPVTLQSLLQSSFSVVDQIMTGQLGSTSIAAIGLAGKFASMYSVLVSAVATVAGIMIAQYVGGKDEREVSRSFFVNLKIAFLVGIFFTALCGLFPAAVMRLYTQDELTVAAAAGYLRIIAFSYLPIAVTVLFSTLFRCMEKAGLPLFASIVSAFVNTGLNYLLIFGKLGFPRMGIRGAAVATLISQIFGYVLLLIFFVWCRRRDEIRLTLIHKLSAQGRVQYIGILLPILTCEFFWSLGENVYSAVYGHIGTKSCAAMSLTAPVQGMFIGALSGIAQAAGILIGKSLGGGEKEEAYANSKKLIWYGLAGSLALSAALWFASPFYVQLYRVESDVSALACRILYVFALIAPVKVLNMILGGGIIRSGGKTKYVMWIDLIGTWIFGVPLALLSAFVLKLPIPYVYAILSLEECVRLAISFVVFMQKKWMCHFTA